MKLFILNRIKHEAFGFPRIPGWARITGPTNSTVVEKNPIINDFEL
jgi:hypothetical protein